MRRRLDDGLRRPHMQLRVHVVPELCRIVWEYLPQLRWEIGTTAHQAVRGLILMARAGLYLWPQTAMIGPMAISGL